PAWCARSIVVSDRQVALSLHRHCISRVFHSCKSCWWKTGDRSCRPDADITTSNNGRTDAAHDWSRTQDPEIASCRQRRYSRRRCRRRRTKCCGRGEGPNKICCKRVPEAVLRTSSDRCGVCGVQGQVGRRRESCDLRSHHI